MLLFPTLKSLQSLGLSPADEADRMSSIMSSAQSSVASSTISGQPAATSSDSGSSLLTSQTTLYLYTFLVTLVVLFALTGGIIARSCMMRRRFRRRMEEAVRNGTAIPSASRRPKVGEQPALHDVWVKDVVEEDSSAEGSDWMQRVIPVAAMLTGLLHDTKATTTPTPRTLTSPSSISVNVIDWFRPNIVTVRRDMNRSTPVLTEEKEDVSQPAEEEPYSAQVTVLIAMPVPHDKHEVPHEREKTTSPNSSSDSKGGSELPVVDFGIMEAVVKEPL